MNDHRYYLMASEFFPYNVAPDDEDNTRDFPFPWEESHGNAWLENANAESVSTFRWGGPLRKVPDVVVELDEPELRTDVIITQIHGFGLFVSGRIRSVFEAFAPGEAQFIRPRLVCEGETVDADFWLMHPVRRLDWFVPEKSVVHERVNSDRPSWVHFGACMIDRSRCDPSVHFGRLQCPVHCVDLVRDDLRSRIIEAGIVGPVFQEVKYLDGRTYTSERFPDWP